MNLTIIIYGIVFGLVSIMFIMIGSCCMQPNSPCIFNTNTAEILLGVGIGIALISIIFVGLRIFRQCHITHTMYVSIYGIILIFLFFIFLFISIFCSYTNSTLSNIFNGATIGTICTGLVTLIVIRILARCTKLPIVRDLFEYKIDKQDNNYEDSDKHVPVALE